MSFFEDIKMDGKDGGFIVNKFGETTNADNGTKTDLWDLTSQAIWLAPTAARIHAIVSSDDNDICGLGTFTVGTNPANTNTVTIGAKVYTFQTNLTDVDGNVKIGAASTNSIDNLIAAINLGAGAGSTYATSMTANAVLTTAAVGAGDTMRLFDLASTNAVTTETLADGSWGSGNTVKGTSARTIRITGLKTWATRESSEDMNMFGTTSQNTANSWVIIHRIEVLTAGDTSRNAGIIKATAATDSTITAQITTLKGQTKMAIYGVPTGYRFEMEDFYGSIIRNAAAVRCEFDLLVNPEPADSITYNDLHDEGTDATGTSNFEHVFRLPLTITGPAIIKIQVTSTLDNTIASGGFEGAVVQSALIDLMH